MSGFAATQHHSKKTHHSVIATTGKYVDINKASATDLTHLKGVGPKKAAAIVMYREKNGAFKSVDDLTQVKGISSKMLDKIERENPGLIKVSS